MNDPLSSAQRLDKLIMDKHSKISDLLWVANSPSLIRNSVDDSLSLRNFSNTDIDNLDHFLNQRFTHRVGGYFENLVQYWQVNLNECELLAHRWKILQESRTLGELDFIFRKTDRVTAHWEVAVKFYLYMPHMNVNGSNWIGPDSRDTFEKKINRIYQHQLEMSRFWPDPIDQRIPFVKGRIYYHPLEKRPSVLPQEMNPHHLKGLWLYHHQVEWLENKMWRFQLLEKPYWLSNIEYCKKTAMPDLSDFSEIHKKFKNHFWESDRPLHLALLKESESGWHEVDKLFIVPNHWPTMMQP
ncbi:MAG TPA: hypothetical protein DD473_26410 [Planctomycetaceae bacterium]|nr:hypothetical protein [Planctomycetaceae bacterium]|tara:strand:- start:97 stop:990 length:894 start_codon:yes stop_codon:yes gene_type:complete